MNALELADQLIAEWSGEGFQPNTSRDAALMLRRQHEAIVKLREALDRIQNRVKVRSKAFKIAEQALQDTEGLK